jgi:AraC-like DNA-binding protein
LPGSDAALFSMLTRTLSDESTQFSDIVGQVRAALRTMIPTGRATEISIAQLLGTHSRTLRRQLVLKGTSFRTLAKEARYEIARQLLTDTGMAITEIAGVLEYADASAFTRAFRRWTKLSPAAWRAQARVA